jgi:hypothetical protein
MIDRTHSLPMVRQCQLLALSRSTAYYHPTSVSSADLALMRRIDELHLAAPFAGARMLRDLLRREGLKIGRKRVRTMMGRGHRRAVPQTPHQPATSRPQGLSLSPAPSRDPSSESRVGGGYHVPSDGTWVCVSLRGDGLGESPSVGVATVEHADDRLLSRRGPGSPDPLWHAGDLQYRSRVSVHQPGIHGDAERPWHPDQHGRHRLLAGQRVCRTAVAEREVRGGIFAGL